MMYSWLDSKKLHGYADSNNVYLSILVLRGLGWKIIRLYQYLQSKDVNLFRAHPKNDQEVNRMDRSFLCSHYGWLNVCNDFNIIRQFASYNWISDLVSIQYPIGSLDAHEKDA